MLSKFVRKYGKTISALALAFGVFTAGPCHYFLHQPQVPAKLKEMAANR